MLRLSAALLCTFLCALSTLALTPARSAAAEKKRVLILGDSISIGYLPYTRELLKDEMTVVRPQGNCEGTTRGVKELDQWLALEGGRWDVIHFNFGLHDLKRVDPVTGAPSSNPAHPRQAELDVYSRQLRETCARLKKTGARLVFATTTPVPPGGVRPHRDPEDVPRYNEAAVKIAREYGADVNDLYAYALPRLKQIQQPVNVHFTEEGYRGLAGEVARKLRQAAAAAAR